MIQHWMKEQLETAFEGVRVTVDYEPDIATYGTVFYEGGGAPTRYDFQLRKPNYMIWIQSKDWGHAELLAQTAFDLFHKYHTRFPNVAIPVEYYQNAELVKTEIFELKNIFAVGEVNRLGVENDNMQYSVNFETLLQHKGEI